MHCTGSRKSSLTQPTVELHSHPTRSCVKLNASPVAIPSSVSTLGLRAAFHANDGARWSALSGEVQEMQGIFRNVGSVGEMRFCRLGSSCGEDAGMQKFDEWKTYRKVVLEFCQRWRRSELYSTESGRNVKNCNTEQEVNSLIPPRNLFIEDISSKQ